MPVRWTRLAFASELNALRNFPGVDREPDRQAIADLSSLLFIPAPETFYRGIRSLQPGEVLEARSRNDRLVAEARNYFNWRICVDPDIDFTDRGHESRASRDPGGTPTARKRCTRWGLC